MDSVKHLEILCNISPKFQIPFWGNPLCLENFQLLHNKSGSGESAFNLRFQEAIIKATTHSPITISNRDPGPLKDHHHRGGVFSRMKKPGFPPGYAVTVISHGFFRRFPWFLVVQRFPPPEGHLNARWDPKANGATAWWVQQPSTNGWQLSPTSPCPSSFWSAPKKKSPNLLWKKKRDKHPVLLHV